VSTVTESHMETDAGGTEENVREVESVTLLSLAPLLHKPFPASRVGFLPKDLQEKDGKWKCKVFPIVEVWDYKRLLNEHAFGVWSVSDSRMYTFDDRLVVFLKVTICGVSHWGVGEEPLTNKVGFVDENATASAWAQAFKRACANFGLGLYLYFLKRPNPVAYNREDKRLAISSEELRALVEGMYRDAHRRNCLQLTYGIGAPDLATLQKPFQQPFPLNVIEFLGHSVKEGSDKSKTCTAVPFVRVWQYVARLNHVAYGQWELSDEPILTSTPSKVIVTLRLNILGHTMIGIGEEFWQETRRKDGKTITVANGHAVENAWAQALKRCLQALGMGLELRFLPAKEGVPYEYGRVQGGEELARELYHQAGLLPTTERQIASLEKLRAALEKEAPTDEALSSWDAEQLINSLTEEYRKRHPAPPPPLPTKLPRVEVSSSDASSSSSGASTSQPALPEQIQRIQKLCERLEKAAPDYSSLTLTSARELISTLTNEYRATVARAK
jgi:hypothetical protein